MQQSESPLSALLKIEPPPAGSPAWPAEVLAEIESNLKCELPNDLKELQQLYPEGYYFSDFVSVVGTRKSHDTPWASYDECWQCATSLARILGFKHSDLIGSHAGALIPIASTRVGDAIAWTVTETKPWPIVILSRSLFREPELFHGSVSEFLLRLHNRPHGFTALQSFDDEEDYSYLESDEEAGEDG